MASGLKVSGHGLHLVPGAVVAQAEGAKSKAVQFFEDIDWHSMAGKRVGAIRRDLMHAKTFLPIVMEALIVRAKESFTYWLSHASSELRDLKATPVLHDLLWPERSPVYVVL